MTRDQALQKIKKCLALARSQNPHEAAAAMRQAQKMMAEHAVTEKDVSLADVQESWADAKHRVPTRWECSLAYMVATAFGCDFIGQYTAKWSADMSVVRKMHFVFFGVGAAAQVASYSYAVLATQCAKARLAHIRKQPKSCKQKTLTARGDAFALGWVWGVQDLIDSFTAVDSDSKLIDQYKAIHYPAVKTVEVKDRTKGRNAGWTHGEQGFVQGKKAQLNRGVGGMAAQGLLS